jgi:hypothetical protein
MRSHILEWIYFRKRNELEIFRRLKKLTKLFIVLT